MTNVSTASAHAPLGRLLRSWPLALAWGIAALAGYTLFFYCDDAFINYRYCGNAVAGHGLVWNPPPFLPVEGYTSFLWVFSHYVIWDALGVPPPVTSIVCSCMAGAVILALCARAATRLPLPERARQPLTALLLLGIAANHTFATWLSSGMETMVFALWCILWTLQAMRSDGLARGGLLQLSLWAALAMLTRPDGLLLLLGTIAMAAHAAWRRQRTWLGAAFSLAPLLLPIAQWTWRRVFYGDWLPNTYYAKVTSAWPESGLRYLYCFAMEHGLWLWLLLVLCWLGKVIRDRVAIAPLLGARFPALVAVGVWLGYAGYYLLVVGGDHFAFRILLHFVPLLFLSSLAMLADCHWRASLQIAWLAGMGLVATLPSWWLERQLAGRELEGFVRVVGRAPQWLNPIAAVYDRQQAWLLLHAVGYRRALHATACAIQREALPERRAGQVAGSAPGMRLICRADAVGVVGWALPDVAILDGHGLNDYVIARSRKLASAVLAAESVRAAFGGLDRDGDGRLAAAEIAAASPLLVSVGPQLQPTTWRELLLSLGDADLDDALTADELVAAVAAMLPSRQMAHEREPPEGYLEQFRPNLVDVNGRRTVDASVVPLTDDELRDVERRTRAQVQK